MTKLEMEHHIQLLIADMFPSETQVGREQSGMNWDCRVRGIAQPAYH